MTGWAILNGIKKEEKKKCLPFLCVSNLNKKKNE